MDGPLAAAFLFGGEIDGQGRILLQPSDISGLF